MLSTKPLLMSMKWAQLPMVQHVCKLTLSLFLGEKIYSNIVFVSAIGIMPRTTPLDVRADHPFFYVIVNEDSVPLFQGTFVGI